MARVLRVLCLGDVVGRPGRALLQKELKALKKNVGAHFVVVNGENAAGGLGLDPTCAEEIRAAGADVITLGDHTWQRKQIADFLEKKPNWCIRPDNFPPGLPGSGWTILTATLDDGVKVQVGVLNVIGRVLMSLLLDCPFRAADALLAGPLASTAVRICDFHAEATSEKVAMLRHLSGRVSLLFGTHTHVPTADMQIDGLGSAYVSDLGMCGPTEGVIGMSKEVALGRFLSGGHLPYEVAEGPTALQGVVSEIDIDSGRALSIVRI